MFYIQKLTHEGTYLHRVVFNFCLPPISWSKPTRLVSSSLLFFSHLFTSRPPTNSQQPARRVRERQSQKPERLSNIKQQGVCPPLAPFPVLSTYPNVGVEHGARVLGLALAVAGRGVKLDDPRAGGAVHGGTRSHRDSHGPGAR